MTATAEADVLITDFNSFASDALYPSWALPASDIISGPTSYSITATGYGSSYKYIGAASIVGAGNTHVELTVTLSGPPAANGSLGPIVTLVDADGSSYNYAWFNQFLGTHVLTMPVESPTWVNSAGTPGLNLNGLQHMYLQLDPGILGSTAPYTVVWENLSLIGAVPEPSTMLLFSSSGALLFWMRRRFSECRRKNPPETEGGLDDPRL